MNVLITGFEPFGDSIINPSQKLVESTSDNNLNKIQLIKRILPVDYDQAPKILLDTINRHQPDVVLAFGLSLGRPRISLERVAVNLMDFRIPDNEGIQIMDQPVVKGGPAAYFPTIPIRAILNSLRAADIPVELSLSAGSFICNQIFYTLMHHIASKHLPILAGFIHLPAQPEQAARSEKPIPSVDLEKDRQALNLILTLLLNSKNSNQ